MFTNSSEIFQNCEFSKNLIGHFAFIKIIWKLDCREAEISQNFNPFHSSHQRPITHLEEHYAHTVHVNFLQCKE